MFFDKLSEFLPKSKGQKPDLFKSEMGKIIQEAREEAGINREESVKNNYK